MRFEQVTVSLGYSNMVDRQPLEDMESSRGLAAPRAHAVSRVLHPSCDGATATQAEAVRSMVNRYMMPVHPGSEGTVHRTHDTTSCPRPQLEYRLYEPIQVYCDILAWRC